MKKTLILVVALIFVVGVAGTAMALITNSVHDFRDGSNDYSVQTGEICKPCHAPHTSNTAYDSMLWNHDASTTTTYQMYGSSTIDGAGTSIDGHSKLCLTCHDGTVGVNAFPDETAAADKMVGNVQIAKGGDDLRGSHPVSITYDTIDSGLRDPLVVTLGPFSLQELLPSDKIQCSTCHDVHNGSAATVPNETDPAGSYLLRVANTASALCLKCHYK